MKFIEQLTISSQIFRDIGKYWAFEKAHGKLSKYREMLKQHNFACASFAILLLWGTSNTLNEQNRGKTL